MSEHEALSQWLFNWPGFVGAGFMVSPYDDPHHLFYEVLWLEGHLVPPLPPTVDGCMLTLKPTTTRNLIEHVAFEIDRLVTGTSAFLATRALDDDLRVGADGDAALQEFTTRLITTRNEAIEMLRALGSVQPKTKMHVFTMLDQADTALREAHNNLRIAISTQVTAMGGRVPEEHLEDLVRRRQQLEDYRTALTTKHRRTDLQLRFQDFSALLTQAYQSVNAALDVAIMIIAAYSDKAKIR